MSVRLYSLEANGRTLCRVTMESPRWLPVRPRVPRCWLRLLAGKALREFFNPSQYLGCNDTSTGSPIFN
jgi:hypothetical protein